jgi:flavodoxin
MKKIQYLLSFAVIIFTVCLLTADITPLAAAGKTQITAKKKILVVYYSRTGNTKKVAEDIAKSLNADIEQLIDKKDRSGAGGYLIGGKDAMNENLTELEPVARDSSKYDVTVIGTPVWCWDMTPAIRTYILAQKNSFKEIAFFTTAGGTKPDKIVKKMEALSGKNAKTSAGFLESDLEEKNKSHYTETISAFVEQIIK